METFSAPSGSSQGAILTPVTSARIVNELKQRIRKYKSVIQKYTNAIDKLGLRDFGVDDLANDNNYFVKMGSLQTNALKARKMLRILNKKLNLMEKEESTVKNETLNGIMKPSSMDDEEDVLQRPIEKLIKYSGSGYESIDKAITRFVNRQKVKSRSVDDPNNVCCTFYEFPSSGDIMNIIRQQNARNNFQLEDDAIDKLAKKVCNDVITLLKVYTVAERKQFLDDCRYLEQEGDDPALHDAELATKLAQNKLLSLEANKQFSDNLPCIDENTELPELIVRESQNDSMAVQASQDSVQLIDSSFSKDMCEKAILSVDRSPKMTKEEMDLFILEDNAKHEQSSRPPSLASDEDSKVIEIIDLSDDP